jgi:hypothetical protein
VALPPKITTRVMPTNLALCRGGLRFEQVCLLRRGSALELLRIISVAKSNATRRSAGTLRCRGSFGFSGARPCIFLIRRGIALAACRAAFAAAMVATGSIRRATTLAPTGNCAEYEWIRLTHLDRLLLDCLEQLQREPDVVVPEGSARLGGLRDSLASPMRKRPLSCRGKSAGALAASGEALPVASCLAAR